MEVGFPLSSYFMLMEKENKASFNLLFNELTVDRGKKMKNLFILLSMTLSKINLIRPGVSKNVSSVYI